MRTETGRGPPPGQGTLCNITGSDRRAADSSRDPYSQPSHLKHIHKVVIFRDSSLKWKAGVRKDVKWMVEKLQVDGGMKQDKDGWTK